MTVASEPHLQAAVAALTSNTTILGRIHETIGAAADLGAGEFASVPPIPPTNLRIVR